MNKSLRKALLVLTITALITGCTNAPENNTPVSEPAETEITEQENNTAEEKNAVDMEGIKTEYMDLKNSDYKIHRNFVELHIQEVDSEFASDMVLDLIAKSKESLGPANDFIYGDNYMEIDKLIYDTYESNQGSFERAYAFFGKDKHTLIELMEKSELRDGIDQYLNQGLGLYNAEGSYYFGLDYSDYFERYGLMVSEDMHTYLSIMDKEAKEHLTIEEYLGVSFEELGKRAVSYETYLKNTEIEETKEDIRMLLMVSLWKLASPTPFDGMADDNFVIEEDMMKVYQELVMNDDTPVIQETVKGLLAFADSRENGVLGSYENSEELMNRSAELHKKADQRIKELYQ